MSALIFLFLCNKRHILFKTAYKFSEADHLLSSIPGEAICFVFHYTCGCGCEHLCSHAWSKSPSLKPTHAPAPDSWEPCPIPPFQYKESFFCLDKPDLSSYLRLAFLNIIDPICPSITKTFQVLATCWLKTSLHFYACPSFS